MNFRLTFRLTLITLLSIFLAGCPFDDDDPTPVAPPPASTDASLSGLVLSTGDLDPTFSATVFSYSASVDAATASISITATTADPNAVLTVDGIATSSGAPSAAMSLLTGANLVNIVVTAEDGTTTQTYSVTVTRQDPPLSSNAVLSGLVIGSGLALTPIFDSNTFSYAATVPDSASSTTVTATAEDGGATLSVNGLALTSGVTSGDIPLAAGTNTVTVNVTAADTTTSLSYAVTLTREQPVVQFVSITALVLNTDGIQVEAAQVSIDGQAGSASSNAEGQATVAAVAAGAQILRVAKVGYLTQLVRLDLANVVDAVSIPVVIIEQAISTLLPNVEGGGTAAGIDGARVTLPADALVDSSGQSVTGSIDVFLTPVDISNSRTRLAFPGSYLATETGGNNGFLASYGTVDFRFEQNGAVLQLATGQTAEIEIPIFVASNGDGSAVVAGQNIALWYLDESTGIWMQEDSGTIVASAESPTGFALRASVTHFSWWNADRFNESSIISARVFCGQVGEPCDIPVSVELCGEMNPNGDGPYSRACTVIDPDVLTELALPTTEPVTLSVIAGPFGAKITPNPLIAGDIFDILDIILVPRHQLGGKFVPGERLTAQMTAIGETHRYSFQGRAGYTFSLSAYPALSLFDEPGLNGGSLGGVVRLIQDGTQLDEVLFEESLQAVLDVEIPADGEVIVEFEAQGKVPGFYLATTRIRPPLLSGANAKVAFLGFDLSVSGVPREVFFVPSGTSNYQRMSGPIAQGGVSTPDGVVDSYHLSWESENWQSPPPMFRNVAPGKIVYVSDEDTADVDELFLVDTSQPGISIKLSGTEVSGEAGVISFLVSEADPSIIVYQVGSEFHQGGDLYLVDTDDPANPVFIAQPTDVNVVNVVSYALGRGGASVLYRVDTDISALPSDGGIYEVLFSNTSETSLVTPTIDFAGGQGLVSFDISGDGTTLVYTDSVRQMYLMNLAVPQTSVQVSAQFHKVISSLFSADGNHLVYLQERSSGSGSGNLYDVDLSDPAAPAAPVLLNSGSNNVIFSYAIDPSSSSVYYGSSRNKWIESVSFETPGSESFTVYTDGTENLQNPVFTADGSGMIVHVASSSQPDYLLYHRFGDSEEINTRISPDFVDSSSAGVSHFEVAADGNTVYFIADISTRSQFEIYSVDWRDPANSIKVVVESVAGIVVRDSFASDLRPTFILLQ